MARLHDLLNSQRQPHPAPRSNVTPINAAGTTRYAHAAVEEEVRKVQMAPQGTRNDALNRSAFNLAQLVTAGHLPAETAREALTNAAHAAGLPAREIDATLRSAWDGATNKPRTTVPDPNEDHTWTPEVAVLGSAGSPATNGQYTQPTGTPPVADAGPSPAQEGEFWASRDLLTHLHDFAKARRASPWGVLGVAMARALAATPPTVHLPPLIGGKGSLNTFIGLVGPSGAGKGIAEAAAADALDVGWVRSARIASGEAITHVYKTRKKGHPDPVWRDDSRAALIRVAEIDRLAGQASRQGSTIMADLRSAWSGELLGQVAADSTRSIPLEDHQYRLCLVAGIQPHRAEILLEDADGGTPQRFLWMPALDEDMPDRKPREPGRRSWQAPPLSQLVGIGGVPIEVCQAAQDDIDAAHVARHRGVGDALDGHALQCQLKVAAALGVMDGRYSVTDADWELAKVVMAKSAATRAQVQAVLSAKKQKANLARAESEAERATVVESKRESEATQRVLRRVLSRLDTTQWRPRAEVRKELASRDRQYFEDAMEQLIDTGQIEVNNEGGHGVQARYRRVD